MSSVSERVYDQATIIALCASVFEHGGLMTLQVHGQSMRPTIRDGALVRIGPLHALPPLGAVVLAQINQAVVLHRVMWRRGNRVLMQGDANLHSDGWLDCSDLVAVVVARHQAQNWHTETPFHRIGGWFWAVARHSMRALYHRIGV